MKTKRSKVPSASHKFIASFSYDHRLAPYDIIASIAHATMLSRQRIISKKDADRIVSGLKSILKDLDEGWGLPVEEDIHYAIEAELIRRVGASGEKVHTGRSRNDQVITDIHLYLKDQVAIISDEIVRLQKAIIWIAQKNQNVIMPGFTHLQHAQPILFAHHVLSYAWMLERDKSRFKDSLKRLDSLPLGSAALAGTSFPLDRRYVARLLKFKDISENSIDATASRDVVIECVSAGAIVMSTLSRFAEELVLWSSAEFGFITLAEEFTSGSSIMPQKRNPDVAEIVRGETGRVYGSLMALLTIVKALPLGYNRDLQEDKPALFDAIDTVTGCLSVMAPMVQSMQVNREPMRRWSESGYLAATELADFLARKGIPFRTAHGVVKALVKSSQLRGVRLNQLTLDDLKEAHPGFTKEALQLLSPEKVVAAKTSYGGTSPASVATQLKKLSSLLK